MGKGRAVAPFLKKDTKNQERRNEKGNYRKKLWPRSLGALNSGDTPLERRGGEW